MPVEPDSAPSPCEALTADDVRRAVGRLPRSPLAHLPTPLEFLPRLTEALGGPRVYMKRDDCTGLAMGGNKTRHNEFLLGDAVSRGADLFVWGAGVQSNNCRQTAAACAKAGLECHLVLGRGRPADGPDPVQGNLLLDHLVGASYEIVDEPVGELLDARIEQVAARFRARGRNVYAWDRHRCKPLAAVSYVVCLAELAEQAEDLGITPDVVYACSAGSTGSGLALGAAALGLGRPSAAATPAAGGEDARGPASENAGWTVRSVCPIRWDWDTQEDMARIANEAAELIGLPTRLEREDIDLTFDQIGPGYGKLSQEGLEAIALVARTEGILLDPIYSGKAMAGLVADVRAGRLAGARNVVFVHTGGTPALFAYSDGLAAGIPRRAGD